MHLCPQVSGFDLLFLCEVLTEEVDFAVSLTLDAMVPAMEKGCLKKTTA